MAKKLWEASKDRKLNSNLYNYEKFISKKFNLKFRHNYKDILNWSIKNIIEGNEIKNIEALANPEVLNQYKNLKELNY